MIPHDTMIILNIYKWILPTYGALTNPYGALTLNISWCPYVAVGCWLGQPFGTYVGGPFHNPTDAIHRTELVGLSLKHETNKHQQNVRGLSTYMPL